MEIFDRFTEIVLHSKSPVVFEFGTCDGHHTNVMCSILKQIKSDPRFIGHKNQFKYYAFEGDYRIGGQLSLSNTRYLYTEYSNDELYEGEIGLTEIMSKLPDNLSIVEDYGYDVLLKK